MPGDSLDGTSVVVAAQVCLLSECSQGHPCAPGGGAAAILSVGLDELDRAPVAAHRHREERRQRHQIGARPGGAFCWAICCAARAKASDDPRYAGVCALRAIGQTCRKVSGGLTTCRYVIESATASEQLLLRSKTSGT
jgi:hypothetical protein